MDEAEKKEKTTPNRRTNKPLMEKRRRQRINDCLVQLKSLVLQAMNKDTTQYSKLEKADILEMTVKHLKMVQRQQMTAAMATDPNVISKYRAGFNECAAEISRYLDSVNGGNPELKARVMNYLGNSMMQFPVIPVYQGVVPPYHLQMTSPATSHTGFTIPPYTHGNNAFSSTHQHTFAHSQKQSREYLHYTHNSESVVKVEPSPVSVNVDFTSHVTSHTTSPVRRIPSPCDSDSGLSDSSFSHDENGNYSNYNINQDLRRENDLRLHQDLDRRSTAHSDLDRRATAHSDIDRRATTHSDIDRRATTHSDIDRRATTHNVDQNRPSPKRKHGTCDESPSKRRSIGENLTVGSPRYVRESDPMWRPW